MTQRLARRARRQPSQKAHAEGGVYGKAGGTCTTAAVFGSVLLAHVHGYPRLEGASMAAALLGKPPADKVANPNLTCGPQVSPSSPTALEDAGRST